ncbi:uncharacterized protein JCM15063_001790 [Sporobolomyces koalae]|uniref:uncharacterized protein n=1 Tax=Sporobolomyces koalae TaxID=500713 RepID=UPI00316E2600
MSNEEQYFPDEPHPWARSPQPIHVASLNRATSPLTVNPSELTVSASRIFSQAPPLGSSPRLDRYGRLADIVPSQHDSSSTIRHKSSSFVPQPQRQMSDQGLSGSVGLPGPTSKFVAVSRDQFAGATSASHVLVPTSVRALDSTPARRGPPNFRSQFIATGRENGGPPSRPVTFRGMAPPRKTLTPEAKRIQFEEDIVTALRAHHSNLEVPITSTSKEATKARNKKLKASRQKYTRLLARYHKFLGKYSDVEPSPAHLEQKTKGTPASAA